MLWSSGSRQWVNVFAFLLLWCGAGGEPWSQWHGHARHSSIGLTKQLLEITAEDEEPKVTNEATAMEWNTWAAGKTSIKTLDAATTEHIGAPKFGTRAQKCERLMRWAVVECS